MLRFIVRAACLLVLASAVIIWQTRASLRDLYGPRLFTLIWWGTGAAGLDAAAVFLLMSRRRLP